MAVFPAKPGNKKFICDYPMRAVVRNVLKYLNDDCYLENTVQ